MRAGAETVPDQVVARDERRRVDRSGRLVFQIILAVIDLAASPNEARASARCRASSSSIPGMARMRLSFASRSRLASPRYW